MLPRNRPPTHPGEILRDEFLIPHGLTQTTLAARLGVSVAEKRNVSAEMALRLSDNFGTTPEFWMNLQTAWDLWYARKHLAHAHHR